MKTCVKCGTEKLKTEFYKCARNKDGLKSYCKTCSGIANQQTYARNRGENIPYSPLRPENKDGKRWCSVCKTFLPLASFGYDAMRTNNLALSCKECNVEVSLRTRTNKKINRRAIFEHDNNMRSLQSKYSIIETDFQDMMNAQKGCCAICNIDFSELDTRACVDHDHETDEIRGLLCNHCNRAIGLLKDNIDILENAIVYLKTRENA